MKLIPKKTQKTILQSLMF